MFRQRVKNRVHPDDPCVRHKPLSPINFQTTIVEHPHVQDNLGQLVDCKLDFHQSEHLISEADKICNFYDIVEEDERTSETHFSSEFVGWFIESLLFRMIMLTAIILNCVVIGLQTDKYLEENYNSVFIAVDKFFLTVFVLEVLIKWYYDFFGFWRSNWNILDFLIVACNLLGTSLAFLNGLTVLRIIRAMKALKGINALRGLQSIVQTVVHSLPDMASIVILLLLFMFVFGILGHSIFGDTCQQFFGSLGSAMFSLFICLTQDGWVDIIEELNSNGYSILGAVYLVIFITIGAFVFVNLVVAVVVTNLEWAIAEQREQEEKIKQSSKQEVPAAIVTVDATGTLSKLAYKQMAIETPVMADLKIKQIENYFLVVYAQEKNLAEFKKIQEQITEIHHEIKALATLEDVKDVSDDEMFEPSTVAVAGENSRTTTSNFSVPPVNFQRRRFNSMACGDAITEMISMSRAHPLVSAKTKTICQVITSLATSSSLNRYSSGADQSMSTTLFPLTTVSDIPSTNSLRSEYEL